MGLRARSGPFAVSCGGSSREPGSAPPRSHRPKTSWPRTGFELYESLAASGRSIPVIFITGHDSASTRDRARAAGAAGYLTKPFHHDQLIDAIAEVM